MYLSFFLSLLAIPAYVYSMKNIVLDVKNRKKIKRGNTSKYTKKGQKNKAVVSSEEEYEREYERDYEREYERDYERERERERERESVKENMKENMRI